MWRSLLEVRGWAVHARMLTGSTFIKHTTARATCRACKSVTLALPTPAPMRCPAALSVTTADASRWRTGMHKWPIAA